MRELKVSDSLDPTEDIALPDFMPLVTLHLPSTGDLNSIFLSSVGNLTLLQDLKLTLPLAPDASFAPLSKLKNLTLLSLGGCVNLSSAVEKFDFANLQELILVSTAIQDKQVRFIADHFPDLLLLNIENCVSVSVEASHGLLRSRVFDLWWKYGGLPFNVTGLISKHRPPDDYDDYAMKVLGVMPSTEKQNRRALRVSQWKEKYW